MKIFKVPAFAFERPIERLRILTLPERIRWFATQHLAAKLVMILAATVLGVAGVSTQRNVEPDELLSTYDRGAIELFDDGLRAFAAAPGTVNAFKRAADRWIEAGANPQRRKLVAAGVTVELAAVLSNWNTGPDFLDAGRSWLKSSGDSEAVRHWYRAAHGAALGHGNADVLLAAEDFGGTFRDPKYRGYSNEALRRFGDDSILLLFRAIAFELKWSQHAPPEWLDREAVERELQSLTRAVARGRQASFPQTARMDVVVAERLLKPDVADLPDVQFVAENSLRLWRVAIMFGGLRQHAAIASEATLRRAVMYEQLARPDLAQRELERALDSPASPFVTYLVHFLKGRHLEKAGRIEDAETGIQAGASRSA